jgi:hypothetical protein
MQKELPPVVDEVPEIKVAAARRKTKKTILPLVAVIIASIAASAATFQTYLAYSVRNQPLRGMDANAIIDAAEGLTVGAPVRHRKMAV